MADGGYVYKMCLKNKKPLSVLLPETALCAGVNLLLTE